MEGKSRRRSRYGQSIASGKVTLSFCSTGITRWTGIPGARKRSGRARQEDKPVFLSIGYPPRHWCHVMARESFADEEVADALNRDFISIKVDREERPDVDAVYMEACQAFTGSGGWPLTILMTPEQKPFFCRDLPAETGRFRPPGAAGAAGAGGGAVEGKPRGPSGDRQPGGGAAQPGSALPGRGSRTGPCCTGPTASSGSGSTRCGAVLDAPPQISHAPPSAVSSVVCSSGRVAGGSDYGGAHPGRHGLWGTAGPDRRRLFPICHRPEVAGSSL